MSFTSRMEYKNFDFGFSLRANLGNYVYDNVQSNNSSYSAIYNSAGYLKQFDKSRNKISKSAIHERLLSAQCRILRCDNITLGYTWNELVQNKLKLRLYGAVQNPFVITKYKGLDPEVFSGIDNNVYPRPVTFLLGAIITY